MSKPGFKFSYLFDKDSHTVEVKLHEEANLEKLVAAFRAFLIACGFAESVVQKELGE